MGFFKDLGGILGGGSESESQSGFGLLPGSIKKAFTGYAGDVTDVFGDGAADARFTPMGQTQYETGALEQIGRGITPTAESLSSDIAMQMNPYDQYVIDAINREAQGDYSILKQAAGEAGQMGSNRQMLGASDIDTQRLGQIGQFKQGQYNKALDNALNQLTQSRAQDVGLGFTAGDFLRGLDMQTQQAPISALQSYGQLLGALPQTGGSTSTSSQHAGIGDAISGIASAAAMSDSRLKQDIEKIGKENGFNIYKFKYLWSPVEYIGVMAQEVMKTVPDAVEVMSNGFMAVHYDKLGLKMRKA
jgi:hypothetical protein